MINNQYSVLKKVGEGHSQVFCCKDKYHPGENFAIKILSSNADCKEEALFNEEYYTLVKLNHPNIIKVAGKGTILLCDENETELHSIEPGCRFFLMEYFDGNIISETEWVRNEDNLRAILVQFASVLLYLHHSNYIYNDLKAENILLKNEGSRPVIKFIDFGLARNITGKENRSAAGTLHYLAPEILQGGKASVKSDFFSLGALLFKLIYNRFPFDGNSESEILTSIINSEPVYFPAECSESIVNILKKLLAKNPGERYVSSLEILNDLETDYKKQIFKQWFPAKVLISREENSLISNYLKDESRFDVLLNRR
jgi:serine/threonine protein kinase